MVLPVKEKSNCMLVFIVNHEDHGIVVMDWLWQLRGVKFASSNLCLLWSRLLWWLGDSLTWGGFTSPIHVNVYRISSNIWSQTRWSSQQKKVMFNHYNSDLSPLSNMIVNVVAVSYINDLHYDFPFWIANYQNLINWHALVGSTRWKKREEDDHLIESVIWSCFQTP